MPFSLFLHLLHHSALLYGASTGCLKYMSIPSIEWDLMSSKINEPLRHGTTLKETLAYTYLLGEFFAGKFPFVPL